MEIKVMQRGGKLEEERSMKPACTCHDPNMGPGQATRDQGGGHIWRGGQGVNPVTDPRPCLTRPPDPVGPGPKVAEYDASGCRSHTAVGTSSHMHGHEKAEDATETEEKPEEEKMEEVEEVKEKVV